MYARLRQIVSDITNKFFQQKLKIYFFKQTFFLKSFNSVLYSTMTQLCKSNILSYDFAVIEWITSCKKTRMTTRVITLWRVYVTPLTTSVSAVRFLAEIMFILKAIKSLLKGHIINTILHLWSFHINLI